MGYVELRLIRAVTVMHPALQPTLEGDWTPWTNKVPPIEVETHRVGAPDVVVPTLDTVRHENILYRY